MSSFYGIWHRDSKPISKELASQIQEQFDWWQPDESDCILQNNLLIGQATLWNTPESKHEHLPLQKDSYILAMDARIDNREELAKELDLPSKPLECIGDSEFILAAYRKWGEACADRLLGDFAFVIWDEKKEHLFCARDFIGVRPFYYYIDDEKFIFGSDLKALSQHPDIPLDIRDESVANYLVNRQLMDRKHTFFQKIYKLEDGCHMTITPTKQTIKRYWHPKKIHKEKLPNRQAYIDRLRELLEDAIKVRMRTAYPVASHLSGGLDSSPIAVLVAREMKKRDPNYKLPVFAWVHPPSSDDDITKHHEWYYPTIIAEQEGMDLHFTTLDSDEMYNIVQLTDIYTHTGNSFVYESKIRPALQQNNIRTMFSGWGGDEFVTNHSYAFYCESFIKGRWNTLHQRATKRLQKLHKHPPTLKNYLKLYYKKIFIPLMPRWLYCYLPKINCKPLDTSLYTEHIKQYALKIYQNKNFIFSRETSCLCSSDLDRAWQNAHIQSRLDIWSQESRPYRFEYTYLLLDRRLVEFSYMMPCKYMIANGFDRVIYREAISHLLPDEILYGIHKNEPIRWNSIGEITQEVLEDIQYKSNQDYILTAKLKEHKETEFHYLSLLTQSKK